MTTLSIISQSQMIEKTFNAQCDKVGSFLDKNPTLYKAVLIASHLFRASSMFAAMSSFPTSPALSFGAMLVPSLMYRSSIERFCIFRFTLPSLAGGAAIWAAKAGAIAFLAKTAFASIASFTLASLGVFSFAAYLGYVCTVSHSDIEKYMETLNKGKGNCCRM